MIRRLALLVLLTIRAPAWAGTPPALHLSITGPPVTVFEKNRDACDALDIPDAPARAIRTAGGQVQLYAPHFVNRRLTGPDLLHVTQDCAIVFQGQEHDDPAEFDDRGWITNLFTQDGREIFASVHDEFQGHRRAWLCRSGRYIDCWYNAIVPAVSHDAGRHFQRMGKRPLASLPYRYEAVTGSHAGYFNPSNIVPFDGALFMTVFTTWALEQKPGNCLLRTPRIADPQAWRAWDGHGFGVRFIDPYFSVEPASGHVCTPVGTAGLRWPVTSLVRHGPDGIFVALMMNSARDGGVFYATSPDLITWSDPARLLEASGESAWRPGGPAPLAYPSLLDPASPDRSFAIIGDSPALFLVRFNVNHGPPGMDRDLIRLPVRIGRAA